MQYPGRFFYPYFCDPRCFPAPYYPQNELLLANESKAEVPKKSMVLKPVATPQFTITQSIIDEVTNYINVYRAAHQAPPLTWDATIATFAQKWSAYLLNNNLFQHSGSVKYGENLAYFKGYGTDVLSLLKLAVDMWYNEIKLYDFKNPGFSHETGHFTALVWKSSTAFGMGISINPETQDVYISMNLSPPGNVMDQFDKNVLEPTTQVNIPPATPIPTPSLPNHESTADKGMIIHSLYNIINEIKKNKNKEIIIHDINKIIADIVRI